MRKFVGLKIAILAVLLATACQTVNQQQVASGVGATRSAAIRGHDLSADEAAGGHTLRKHVGRTDEQLRERLQSEPSISAASTYTDRATAELAVANALEHGRGRIQNWLDREGGHPNLVVDYDSDSPIGRTMRRGDSVSRPCSHAVVVLRWAGGGEYYVLTTYPECRS